MTLRTRLTLGLLTIAVILVVPLLVAMRSLDLLHNDATALRDGDFAASLVLGRLRDAVNDVRSAELALQFVKDRQSLERMTQRVATVELLADSLERYQLGGAARDIRAAMNDVSSAVRPVFNAAVRGRGATAEEISLEQVVPAITRADSSIARAERSLGARTRARVDNATQQAKRGQQVAVIGLALALVVATIIAVLLTQSVSRPVHELVRGMKRVADGDFQTKLGISSAREDEFGQLAAGFEDMTRQLAELDRLKAEFVSVASHELKTPINVILGYTQLLQEELYGPLTDKQRNVANVLEKQTHTLARLVKQLLDISRFEAGSGRIDPRPTELKGMFHNLEEAFQVLADQRGVRFRVVMHEGLPDSVHWDPDRMNEALGNLLANAFKFTDRGGEVELSAFPVDHGVQLSVRDTGAGIPADQVPRIFDKFYQADNQDAAAHAGTGLGLAIVRHIVEAHKGTIECDSTPGVGTTFTMVLPERVDGRRSSAQHEAIAEVA